MLYDKLANALDIIPVIIGTTLINVLIAFVMGLVTFLQLIAVAGWSKLPSEVTAVLVAVAVLAYIWLQPKIRSYIDSRSRYE